MIGYFKKINFLLLVLLLCSSPVWAGSAQALTVSGAVNHPLTLDAKGLDTYKSIDVQLNEITSKKEFNGAFVFHGVSLKTLLDAAEIEKKDSDFKKPVDLAVIVKSKGGTSVALSWGEIFYKNPGNVMIATSADPIFPHKGIDHFKDKDAYHKMMKTLNREIGFPKLVMTGDFYTDRCIEGVTDIIVYDLRPNVPGEKSPTVFSERFQVSGNVAKPLNLDKLDLPHMDIITHVVGEGRGYHGTKSYRGVELKSILDMALPELDLNTVFLLSAPDAYRVLISYGELYLNTHGNRILITDTCNGKPLPKNGGKFLLVLPDDLMADRELKSVSKIDVLRIPR